MAFTPKEKQTIEQTKIAIDNLIACFAKHPSVDLETFKELRIALENMGETLSVADDINDILGI